MSTSILVRDEGDFSHWSMYEWLRETTTLPTEGENWATPDRAPDRAPDFSHWSVHEWLRETKTLPTEGENFATPDFSHCSVHEWLRETTNDEKSIQMDVNSADQEEEAREEEGCAPMDTETPSGGGLLREESSSNALPPPPPPRPPLPSLPPQWNEAFDVGTGQKYYYNVRTHETSWERPRQGKITLDNNAEAKNSVPGNDEDMKSNVGIEGKGRESKPENSLPHEDEEITSNAGIEEKGPESEPENSLPDEDEDMKANAGIEEKDSGHSIPSPSTSDSPKIQQEKDKYSVRKIRWRPRPFKSGEYQSVKKIMWSLFKPGSGDQKGNGFSPRTPLLIEFSDTSTNTISPPQEENFNTTTNESTEEKQVMVLIKKVPIFELLDDHVLDAICACLSSTYYLEDFEVFREKEPIEHMLFIARGNLECHGEDGSILQLKEGDFCGEELLFRCINTAGVTTSKKINQEKHPLSRRTIKCRTAVEAFSLDSEALEHITVHYKASFESPLIQGSIRYFSRHGWSLAASHTHETRTSDKETNEEAPSTDATSMLENSTQNKEDIEHDDEVSGLQNVPIFEDSTDTLNSSSQLPDADDGLKMDVRNEEGDDVDSSGTKMCSEDLNNAASPTSPVLGEEEQMKVDTQVEEEDITSPLVTPSISDPSDTPPEGGKQTGKKNWWKQFRQGGPRGKKIGFTDKKDDTEEHDDQSPQITSPCEGLSDNTNITSPSLNENVFIEANVAPEERETSSSITVPSGSNSNKIEQENDSHLGKNIWSRPFKSGGHQEGMKFSWRLFQLGSGDHSVSPIELIRKVPIFELLEGHILEAICEHLSVKKYTKTSEVLSKEKPVKCMLFIVRGKLEYIEDNGSIVQLKEGDFCGEELLSWCTDRAGVSTFKTIDHHGRHPLSSRTIKCLSSVKAFSLDFQALESITTLFKFAFRSPFVQGQVRYLSLDWRSLAATQIQRAWRFSKGLVWSGQAHLDWEIEPKSNDFRHANLESGDITLDRGMERENSSSETEDTASNTEPSQVEDLVRYESAEKGESIRDHSDDDVPSPPTNLPSQVLSDSVKSAATKPPSDVLSDTANSAPLLVAEDQVTESNQEVDTSDSANDPATSDHSKIGREDGGHSVKKSWWLPFRSGGDQAQKKKRSPQSVTTEDLTIQLEGMPRRFSYKQLKVATGGFGEESKLGQGGFGSVYKGVLFGNEVAVKKMDGYAQNQGVKEFLAEVTIINKLRHRNLIQLLGWCDDLAKKKYLLVYELMPNGSLEEALFRRSEKEKTTLSWPQRLNILIGTAAGLEYLHQGGNEQIIHRDVKCSNIIIDKNWNGKLGDFGLARLVDHDGAAATTNVAGTMGYIAPEVIFGGRFTEKADVFGFGVVALEVACGRRVYAGYPDQMGLIEFVWHALSEGDLLSTADERLNDDYDEYWMEVVLMVGLLCTHPEPQARPSMRRVVQILSGDVPVPSIPASKPTPTFCSLPQISITDLPTRKPGGKSRSKSTSQISMTSASTVTSSNSDFSIGLTRSSN